MLNDYFTDQSQEHFQDSAFCDTWQAAEAAQFLKDEAYAAECERDQEERDLLDHFRENYPLDFWIFSRPV